MVNIEKVNEVLELEKLANWEMDNYDDVLYATKVKLLKACQQLTKEDVQYINKLTNNDTSTTE
jgi:hypothetical protein